MGNLTNCVGVRVGIRISLTLSIEAIASIASIASVVATVTDSSIARDEAMAIVNSSDDTTAIAIGSLADGVWLAVCQGSSCQDSTKEVSHHNEFRGDSLTTTGPH